MENLTLFEGKEEIKKPLIRCSGAFNSLFYSFLQLSVPGGARTLDPLIKSQLLYQLSYRNSACE